MYHSPIAQPGRGGGGGGGELPFMYHSPIAQLGRGGGGVALQATVSETPPIYTYVSLSTVVWWWWQR